MQVEGAEGAGAGLRAEHDITRAATVAPAAESTLRRLQRLQSQQVWPFPFTSRSEGQLEYAQNSRLSSSAISHGGGVQEQEKAREQDRSRRVKSDASAAQRKEHRQTRKKEQYARRVQAQQSEAWRPRVGDTVDVPKLGQQAVVQSVKGKKVNVTLRGMPITVTLADVVRI